MLLRIFQFTLLLLFLVKSTDLFIINNKFVNSDGVKVFTVSNVIKNNNCTCACNCASNEVPLERPLSAPQAPIPGAPKQFVIRKVIHQNHCNCACSCVPKESEISSDGIQKSYTAPAPKVHDAVKEQVWNELKTTIENSYRTTPIQRPNEEADKASSYVVASTTQSLTTRSYWQTSSLILSSEQPATGHIIPSTQQFSGYFTGPPPREDAQNPTISSQLPSNSQMTSGNWPQSLWPSSTQNNSPILSSSEWSSSTVVPSHSPTTQNEQPSTKQISENILSTVNSNSSTVNWWSSSVFSPSTKPKITTDQQKSTNEWPPTNGMNNWLTTTLHVDRNSSVSTHLSAPSNIFKAKTTTLSTSPTSSTNAETPQQSKSTKSFGTSNSPSFIFPTEINFNGNRSEQQTAKSLLTTTRESTVTSTEKTKPTITEDDEITTATITKDDKIPSNLTASLPTDQQSTAVNLSQFTGKKTTPLDTTTQQKIQTETVGLKKSTHQETSPQTSIWTSSTTSETRLHNPGLEISRGQPDSTFTQTVAIGTTTFDAKPTTSPHELSGDTTTKVIQNSTVISAEAIDELVNTVAVDLDESSKSGETTQKTSSQPLIPEIETTDKPEFVSTSTLFNQHNSTENANLSPEFKQKVYQLLTQLKAQLQHMKTEVANTSTTQPVNNRNQETTTFASFVQTDALSTSTVTDRQTTVEWEDDKLAEFNEQLRIMMDEAKNQTINENNERERKLEKSSDLMKKLDNIRGMLDKMKQRTTTNLPVTTTTLTITTTEPLQTTQKADEFDGIATTVVIDEKIETTQPTIKEPPTTESTERRDFIRKLHSQLLKLKDRLEEMRHANTTISFISTTTLAVPPQTSQTLELTTSAGVTPEEDTKERLFHYDDLKARLANLKNTLDSMKEDNREEVEKDKKQEAVDSTEIMRDQMRSMLSKLKTRLNELKEQEAAAQRTTISFATTTTFTPPIEPKTDKQSTITSQPTNGNLAPTHQLTTLTTQSVYRTLEQTSTSLENLSTADQTKTTLPFKTETQTNRIEVVSTLPTSSDATDSSTTTQLLLTDPITQRIVQLSTTKESSPFNENKIISSSVSHPSSSQPPVLLPSTNQPTISQLSTLITEIEEHLTEEKKTTQHNNEISTTNNNHQESTHNLPQTSNAYRESTSIPAARESTQLNLANNYSIQAEALAETKPTTADSTSHVTTTSSEDSKKPAFVQLDSTDEETFAPEVTTLPLTSTSVSRLESSTEGQQEITTEQTKLPFKFAPAESLSTSQTLQNIVEDTTTIPQVDEGRRGLEIAKLVKSSNSSAIGFSEDDVDDQTFIDRGDETEMKVETKLETSATTTTSKTPSTFEATQSTTVKSKIAGSFKIGTEVEGVEDKTSKDVSLEATEKPQITTQQSKQPSDNEIATLKWVEGDESSTSKPVTNDKLPEWYQQKQLSPELIKMAPEIARLIFDTAAMSARFPNLQLPLPVLPDAIPNAVPEVPALPAIETRRRVNIRPSTTTTHLPIVEQTFTPLKRIVSRPKTTTITPRIHVQTSDELYDDYEDHRPTLPSDAPTRRPKTHKQKAKTIELNTIDVKEKATDNQFSVDANANKVDEEQRIDQSNPSVNSNKGSGSSKPKNVPAPADENLFSKRLEEARRLREQLEMETMHENVQAKSGIQFQNQASRREELEQRLAELAEEERWNRLLLEKAQLNRRIHANALNEMKTAPTAKPIATTTTSVSPTVDASSELPAHCKPVQRFLEVYKISNPRLWVRENCESAKQVYPHASCSQIEELLAVCFTQLVI